MQRHSHGSRPAAELQIHHGPTPMRTAMTTRFALAITCVALMATTARADRIDFSALVGSDVADANGQNFPWQFGAASGTVNVKASYPQVLQINGAIRTPVQPPASFGSPFFGMVTLTFDQPVEVAVLATFASMTRDAIDGGRFEQVQLTTSGAVAFSAADATTAIYTGAGTNSITADDQFPPTPPLSIWGFVGDGVSNRYTLQYTGTTNGLSETFDVHVIPEPAAWPIAICGAALCALVRGGANILLWSLDHASDLFGAVCWDDARYRRLRSRKARAKRIWPTASMR